MRSRTKIMCALLAVLLVVLLVVYTDRPLSFAQLWADADAVPAPPGLTFIGKAQSIENGPGFTTKKYESVSRQYASTLSCDELERRWADDLRAAHRRFEIANYPHSSGSIGSQGIRITDRTHPLGITIGTDNGYCSKPFVYSFNRPH